MSPKEFGKHIGKSVNILQRWDNKEILIAHRAPPSMHSVVGPMDCASIKRVEGK